MAFFVFFKMGSAQLSPALREIKQLLCVQNFILYFIKQILGLHVTSSFWKSETREPPKLSSSGMREGKFISVNNFSAREHASSRSGHIFNFRVMAVRDIKI